MAGIMDFLQNMTPEQNNALLTAGSQILMRSGPGRPFSLGQAMGTGGLAYQDSIAEQQARAQQTRMQDLSIRGAEGDLAAQQRALETQNRMDEAARNAYRSPGAQAASLPGGPTPENAAQMGSMKPEFNMEGYIDAMMSIDPLKALEIRRSMVKAGPKFDSGITFVNGPDGKPMAVRTADDGSYKQLDGLSPREKLEFRDGGDGVYGLDQFTGEQRARVAKGLDPSAILSAQTQMRGQNMTDSRQREANDVNRQGARTQIINDPATGPMIIDRATGQARPVMMNGQPVQGETAAKKAAAGKSLAPLIEQAGKLIDDATGSYLGAGVDQAARWYGKATPGAQAIAKLSVLEGNIMMAQPRMEGPQSNMDVALYRQMAAQIGDPTVPNETKKAALSALKSLYSKYEPNNPPAGGNNAGGAKFLGFE